jgi:putative tryptophan/tyrosine transport system substrate-binding protein
MNGIGIKRHDVRPDGDMEMAMRTFQKDPVGQVCDRLLLMMVLTLVISSMYPLTCVHADDRNRPVRIGVLTESWGPTPQVIGLRDGLTELGYQEDRDYFLGIRFTQGNRAALPAAARELVELGVDLIFADTNGAKAAQLATSQIPIVFASENDPIGDGVVQSFARPGGNITGVADLTRDLGPKRLQLFQEMIPGLRRVLFPYDASSAAALKEAETYRRAARQLGIELVEKPVRTPEEARDVLSRLQPDEVDGVLPPICCALNIPGFVLDIMTPKHIPAMFESAFWPERGAVASYGQDFYESGRQAARLVDKILKGQKPGEIPVEVNSKLEFVINLKTAKAMGLTIAPEVLFQADRIIR